MNAEKLTRMQAQVRIGGKGTVRRKKKTIHKTDTTNEKKLQSSLQKIGVNQISGIEEANLFMDDGSVMHFKSPRVQASFPSNTFALNGQYEDKQLTELLPGIINQMWSESTSRLDKLAGTMDGAKAINGKSIDNSDDDVRIMSYDEVMSSIDQSQANDKYELPTIEEENGVEHSAEDNDDLALDLDNLTLEESDKVPQLSEKENSDGVNKTVNSNLQINVKADSSSSESYDNKGSACNRISQLIDEEDDIPNEKNCC